MFLLVLFNKVYFDSNVFCSKEVLVEQVILKWLGSNYFPIWLNLFNGFFCLILATFLMALVGVKDLPFPILLPDCVFHNFFGDPLSLSFLLTLWTAYQNVFVPYAKFLLTFNCLLSNDKAISTAVVCNCIWGTALQHQLWQHGIHPLYEFLL